MYSVCTMRIRTIKPAFFRSQDVADMPYRQRITFIGLWLFSDDEGRSKDEPKILFAELYALEDDVTWRDVDDDLRQLDAGGQITRYEADGGRYIQVLKWGSHQVISRATESKFPAPPDYSVSGPGVNFTGKGKGIRNKEEEKEREAEFATLWESYPHKVNRAGALKSYISARDKVDAATIMNGLVGWLEVWKRPGFDPQYVPHATTWLNQARWEAEPTKAGKPVTATDRTMEILNTPMRADRRAVEQ